jgi:hypothetical protein
VKSKPKSVTNCEYESAHQPVHVDARKLDWPEIKGHIEISVGENGIFIGGDPQGLKSLADTLLWLAHLNQAASLELSNEIREHRHLHPGVHLSRNSTETELCRLDAKGTGEFPEDYVPARGTKKTKPK